MNHFAVLQAKQRLEKATNAIAAIKASKSYDEAEAAWVDFLVAAGAIYSKLEQGAKGHSKSEPWFGRKKKIRREDPLLRYLHYARNSSEHGLDRVAGLSPSNKDGYGRRLKFNERTPTFKFKAHDGQTGEVKAEGEGFFAGPTLAPITIHDRRFGDKCEPPRIHLGKDIKVPDFIFGLAETAIVYLAELVAEAETLL